MAILYITEYMTMGQVLGHSPMPQEPAVTTQTVAIAGGHAESAVLNVATRYIRIHTDVICSILVGVGAVATTTSPRFAANQTEFRAVPEGGNLVVSVILNI